MQARCLRYSILRPFFAFRVYKKSGMLPLKPAPQADKSIFNRLWFFNSTRYDITPNGSVQWGTMKPAR
ncbi:MAG: hypothetical protein DCC43_08160 [Candidatus Brocadia sp.]|nr:hypothetical protein [Candidatus Brocadia sp. AMX3]RIJ99551.1 MAG: hypothetical protein DCC43_08160 [Candidatus Brocadia sp.]